MRQFYLSRVPSVLNPSFDNEQTYANIRFPDAGHQRLALFRYWNMVEYFYPNRAILSNDPTNDPNYGDEMLQQYIPAVALAGSSNVYQWELMEYSDSSTWRKSTVEGWRRLYSRISRVCPRRALNLPRIGR